LRLCIRYTDAHRGFVPIPRVRSRVVLVDDIHPGPKKWGPHHAFVMLEPPKREPRSEPRCSRKVYVKPYDWKKRRTGVLERFKNVKDWVQPIGFSQDATPQMLAAARHLLAMQPKELPGKSWNTQQDEEELTYLIATQDCELAPLAKELAANGVPASSKDATREGEDGDLETGDVPDGTYLSTGLSDQYTKGRREQFAHDTDERTWHSTYARRAKHVTNDQGQRGVVPKPGNLFTHEELLAILTRKPGEMLDEGEIGFYLDNLDISEDRNEFEVADQLERYEKSQDRNGYAAGFDCPEQSHPREDGSPLCQKGTVPITENAKVIDYEDCPTCGGTGTVQSLLGSDLPIVDSE
jgi:hypothetical protein